MRCGLEPWIRTIPWKSAWQPTPVYLLGKSQGERSLVDYVNGVAKSQTTQKVASAEATEHARMHLMKFTN